MAVRVARPCVHATAVVRQRFSVTGDGGKLINIPSGDAAQEAARNVALAQEAARTFELGMVLETADSVSQPRRWRRQKKRITTQPPTRAVHPCNSARACCSPGATKRGMYACQPGRRLTNRRVCTLQLLCPALGLARSGCLLLLIHPCHQLHNLRHSALQSTDPLHLQGPSSQMHVHHEWGAAG